MLGRNARRTRQLPLVVALRVLGTLDMLALVAVVMPASWIQLTNQWCGLGDFPAVPIAGYLARSSATLYGLHGIIVFYMSFEVARYWRLIRFMATLALFHGLVMLAIDLVEGMPIWWTVVEGPAFTATGAIVLSAQRWSAWQESRDRVLGRTS